MATAVQIELLVDEKGAVQGIRTFDTALKGTAGTTSNLDATLKQLNATLEKTAVSGANAGRGAGRALRQVKEDGLSAREGIHLITEEFGIEMPRAFKNLISQSSLAKSAIGAVSGAIVGLGAIQIGVMVFEQLIEGSKKLWENYISIENAQEAYQQELDKMKEEDYWKSDSIETTTMRIQEATVAMKAYRNAAEGAHSVGMREAVGGLLSGNAGEFAAGAGLLRGAHDMAGEAVKAERAKDKLTPEQAEQQHEINLRQIEYNHSLDQTLARLDRIGAEERRRNQENAENRRYLIERGKALGNTVAPDAGKTEQAAKDAIAEKQAWADTYLFEKEQRQELQRMQESALEASLHGEALYHAQEAFAIEDLKNKDMNSIAARKAIHDKFHAEELKRLQAENLEIQKMDQAARLSGLTGIAKIRQEGADRIDNIYKQNAVDGKMNPSQLLKAVNDQATLTKNEIAQVYVTFGERVDSVLDEATGRTLQGFAKIHADAQHQIRDLEREFREKGGKPEDLTRGEAGIRADEAAQVADLSRKNADDTARIEAEARARSLSAEKQQTLAIQTEYDERVREYQSQLDQQMISQDDFNRRVVAAEEERNAQLVEAAKAAREKMAGEFTRFFRDPMGTMKEMGEKAAGEAAAAMWQRIQSKSQGAGATPQVGLPFPGMENWSGAGFGGIFDRIAGKTGHPGGAAPEMAAHHAETLTPSSLSMAHAEIRVGVANISLPASAAVAGSAPSPFNVPASSSSSGVSFTSLAGGSTSLASTGGFAGADGSVAGSGTNAISSGINNATKSVDLIKQANSFFTRSSTNGAGGGAGSILSEGSTSDSGSPFQIAEEPLQKLNLPGRSVASNGMLGGGGIMANAGGAFGGAAGLFSAYQGNGGFGGALGGAMSGMEFGMAVGGPIGAAVGLVGGAVLGAIGFGGREKGRVYDLKTVRPRLKNDFDAFQAGSMDYTSAYSDMQALDQEARTTLGKMGGSAKGYYWDTINKEIHQAEGKLTAEQKAGRSMFTMSAAQFDIGTDYVPRTGMAVIHEGERIIPSDHNERITRVLESAGSHSHGLEAALSSYQTAMRAPSSGSSVTHGPTIHMPIQAIDTRDFVQRIQDVKHQIRASLNSTYAENSGGSDAGY